MAGIARPIDAPAVAEGGRQAADQDVPVVASAVAVGVQRDGGQLSVLIEGIDDKEYVSAVPAVEGEVDAVRRGAGAEGKRTAARDSESKHILGKSAFGFRLSVRSPLTTADIRIAGYVCNGCVRSLVGWTEPLPGRRKADQRREG